MPRPSPMLVIDARPRGPQGPLAGAVVRGRPVLAHLIDLAGSLGDGPIAVHARVDEHPRFRSLVGEPPSRVVFATGPPPEGAAILRTDRIYDAGRLRRALRRGRDPESAVAWRLDRPAALAEADRGQEGSRHSLAVFDPTRRLAAALNDSSLGPLALSLSSAAMVLGAASAVAFAAGAGAAVRWGSAAALGSGWLLHAIGRRLGESRRSSSEFDRWADDCLVEFGDLALHAAIAWAGFVGDGRAGWLLLGMGYGMARSLDQRAQAGLESPDGPALVRWFDRARWPGWIALAALGRLDLALMVATAYFPLRTLGLAWRKGRRHD